MLMSFLYVCSTPREINLFLKDVIAQATAVDEDVDEYRNLVVGREYRILSNVRQPHTHFTLE